MNIKIVIFVSLLVAVSTVNAALIDNGTYTTDTSTGLDWLDLTETAPYSYNTVYSELGTGGQFEGWAYASTEQVRSFFDSAGGNGNYTSNVQNYSAESLGNLWGWTRIDATADYFQGSFLVSEKYDDLNHLYGYFYVDQINVPYFSDGMVLPTNDRYARDSFRNRRIGSALVRVSAVPVPAAVWLFGSALLGLVGLKRKQ